MLNLQLFFNNKYTVINNNVELESINKKDTNCAICLEQLNEDNSNIELLCKHFYHEDCMFELIAHGFRARKCKRIQCIEYKCPQCRKKVPYENIKNIIVNYYRKNKLEYKNNKQIIKKKRNELFIMTIKFQLKGIIQKHKQSEIFKYLEKSEEINCDINDLTFELNNKKKHITSIYRMLIRFI